MSQFSDEIHTLEISELRAGYYTDLKWGGVYSLGWATFVFGFFAGTVGWEVLPTLEYACLTGLLFFGYLWFRYWRLYSRARVALALERVGQPD